MDILDTTPRRTVCVQSGEKGGGLLGLRRVHDVQLHVCQAIYAFGGAGPDSLPTAPALLFVLSIPDRSVKVVPSAR